MLPTAIDPERLGEVCQRYGVVRLDVFGSTNRGFSGSLVRERFAVGVHATGAASLIR